MPAIAAVQLQSYYGFFEYLVIYGWNFSTEISTSPQAVRCIIL